MARLILTTTTARKSTASKETVSAPLAALALTRLSRRSAKVTAARHCGGTRAVCVRMLIASYATGWSGNYRGRGRWYPGKVGRVHSDGTYTVDYDDGEQERRIDAAMVRAIGGAAPGSPKKHKMREGDRVEANYRGRGKWFKGKIDREHYDGTYDRLSLRRETCVPPLVVLKVRSLRR